jgi:pimeloyl-ACP methyl ester carboxylesterase
MPFASIEGQDIYYEDSGGKGMALLLCHGFFFDQAMFAAQVAALSPTYRVIRLDLRGFGETGWDGRPFSLWDCARDALLLLDRLKIQDAVVGGMSMGGFIAQRMALLKPDRMKGLVLLSTSARTEDAAAKAGLNQIAQLWSPSTIDAVLQRLAGSILGPGTPWESWISRWRRIPKTALVAAMQALVSRESLEGRLQELSCRALVLHGSEDTLIPIPVARDLAQKLAHASLVEIRGAHHAPNITHASLVNHHLMWFLKSLQSA